jgi:2-oxo-4-hydroxy-4-carboxy-5-ureidoimidazoline decarboxylase
MLRPYFRREVESGFQDGRMGRGIAEHLNSVPEEEARAALIRCCGARRWVEQMLAARPFASDAELHESAERIWWALGREDWLEAFAGHPRIGARTTDRASRREQAGVEGATAATRAALALGNRAYEERFGHVFLVCATGKTAGEMLGALRDRLANDPATELRIAAGEQAKITRLRLEALAAS